MSVHNPLDQVGVAGPATPGAHCQPAGELSFGRGREGGTFLVVNVHPVDAALGCAAATPDGVADGVQAVADQPVDACDAGVNKDPQKVVCHVAHDCVLSA